MEERQKLVTVKGNPVTLVGDPIEVGDHAPDFRVVDNEMNSVNFSSFLGKVLIISSVPSLDTPVCEIETKRFNEEAGRLGKEVQVLTISMDLPFAQKRWCAAAEANNLLTLSDYRHASFGLAWGVLIKELRLLARAVFVVDRKEIVRYVELVKETGMEPDYDAVLAAVKGLIE